MSARLARVLAAAVLLLVAAPGAGWAAAPSRRPALAGRLSFAPNDPFLSKQWYLQADGALQAFGTWATLPALPGGGVRVAVIDSGLDGEHPEFQGRIATGPNGAPLAVSFVGGSALVDEQGHGTFVAGEIAAAIDNGVGIAGIAFPAQLMIAKVVRPDGSISLEAEAKAIRWAVDNGARVVNLSLGGVRDPTDPKHDTYSRLEAAAVSYAVAKGAVVVAAVGNADQAPSVPWNYASYPAALPHVIGVSALARDGSVPTFSDRDAVYNDIAAPGEAIFSTFPRALTAASPACPDQGYSDCAGEEYRDAEGTSFAAPQVSAAAALMLAVRPDLKADQVAYLLERTARDIRASTGCAACPSRRTPLAGWGALDVAGALAALAGPLPPADAREPNDDAGDQAATLWGRVAKVTATLDFWDDQIDVYRIRLRRGQWVSAGLKAPAAAPINLVLWKPGTEHVEGLNGGSLDRRIEQGDPAAVRRHVLYQAPAEGWYYIEAKATDPSVDLTAYTLTVTKSLLS